jgi:hypothetical protein
MGSGLSTRSGLFMGSGLFTRSGLFMGSGLFTRSGLFMGSGLSVRSGLFSLLLGVVVLGGVADVAESAIYKYVDREGVSHYTDAISQVPHEYRDQVRDISPQMEDMTGFHVVEGLNGESPGAAPDEAGGVDIVDMDLGDFGGSEMVSGVLDSLGFGVILLVLLAIPALYVFSAWVFQLACRIGGEDPPGLGRACGILFIQGIAGSAVGAAVTGIGFGLGINAEASMGASIAVTGASSTISWMANAAILASMMSYGFVRSMWIGLLHTVLVLVMIGGPIAGIAMVVALAG